MKKLLFTLTFAVALSLGSTNAQINEIGKFFAGGADDAETLANGYLAPYFNAFGASMTGGWYNTAKSHKLGGFDITATFNTAIVPSSDKSFDILALDLVSLKYADIPDNNSITPTIAGENETGTQLNYAYAGAPETKALDMPKGTGWAYIPSPMLQLGVGLVKDTEINGRYMPTFNGNGAKIGMWGIGAKHGLKQWIPFIKKVPVLHLSVQYGYTKMNSSVDINVTPADINAIDNTSDNITWDNQAMEWVTQSHTANLIISADLPIVCFYGAVGFASTKTDLNMTGYFPSASNYDISSGNIVVEDSGALLNPISTEFKNSDGNATKPRFNAGMRFKFAVVTLHFDYTYANYSMVTAGLGISFR